MTKRRVADTASQTSHKTAGRREADAIVRSFKDEPVRELLVAGGLRGLKVRELFA